MTGFSLIKNTAFELDGIATCIVRIQEDGSVSLEDTKSGTYSTQSVERLLEAYTQGRICQPSTDIAHSRSSGAYGRPFAELPQKQQALALRSKRYLDGIRTHGPLCWTRKSMEPRIREVAQKLGDARPPDVSTVYRWHRDAMQSADLRCLVPRFDRRGPRAPLTNPEVVKLFMQALVDVSTASKGWTVQDAQAQLQMLLDRENRSRPLGEQLHMPKLRTLYRLLDRVEEYDLAIFKEGEEAAKRRFKITRVGVKTTRILERVEIDHTPLDVFLVKDESYIPCGRPTLTLLIDHFSRMPLGYYLSFGGTSMNAVIRALRHAILPKTPVAEAVAALKIHHKWPCYGLMDELVTDNGLEFHGSSVEVACFLLNIQLHFCPARQPRFKGVIERYLKTVNYTFVHKLPGTSLAKWTDRGDYDPLKHAVMTMSEFQHVFEKWLLDVYAQTYHKGIKTTPFARWCESAKVNPPYLPDSMSKLVDDLGISTTRSLRHDGIRLHNLYYASGALQSILRAYGEGVKVRVTYDPENLGRVHVWSPDSQDPVVAYATELDYAAELTLTQHKLLQDIVVKKGQDETDLKALMQAKIDLAAAIRAQFTGKRLRDRKRAAKAMGISTERPKGTPPVTNSVETSAAQVDDARSLSRKSKFAVEIPTFTVVQRNWN
ncbi:Mu transposase C-terminal domain-containing protein [Cupriavidus basilensis]|uniref:Mu transposase C-terminal domain-containing protein n=1 Tax=Cupriavidus basilensis TaxID=68895 RepID=UPI00157A5EE5|nr:Mu transposase C-terminal domain-containing protein [Cupriavidus basilensis]NUA30562.1 DDE-type integrase/transposase/recombinase [Cupriavidus basilensis]